MNNGSIMPLINSPRLLLRMLEPREADIALKFYADNKEFLEKTSPKWTSDYFELSRWQKVLENYQAEFLNGASMKLFIFEKSTDRVIGFVNFNNIVRGVAQYRNVGYSLAENKQGQGYMAEALEHAIEYIFVELNVHRIEANYMPHNVRSGRVLKKLGFVAEGFARDYLLINGQWEDHVRTALTNDNWRDFV